MPFCFRPPGQAGKHPLHICGGWQNSVKDRFEEDLCFLSCQHLWTILLCQLGCEGVQAAWGLCTHLLCFFNLLFCRTLDQVCKAPRVSLPGLNELPPHLPSQRENTAAATCLVAKTKRCPEGRRKGDCRGPAVEAKAGGMGLPGQPQAS